MLEDKLKEYLVEQGSTGCSHEQIRKHFKNVATTNELQILLDLMWHDRKVDKYIINQGRGRPSTWWRATTRMLEDD